MVRTFGPRVGRFILLSENVCAMPHATVQCWASVAEAGPSGEERRLRLQATQGFSLISQALQTGEPRHNRFEFGLYAYQKYGSKDATCQGKFPDCSLDGQSAAWMLRLWPGGSHCSLEAQMAPWMLRVQPGCSDCDLQAHIAPWRLRLHPGHSDCTLESWPPLGQSVP